MEDLLHESGGENTGRQCDDGDADEGGGHGDQLSNGGRRGNITVADRGHCDGRPVQCGEKVGEQRGLHIVHDDGGHKDGGGGKRAHCGQRFALGSENVEKHTHAFGIAHEFENADDLDGAHQTQIAETMQTRMQQKQGWNDRNQVNQCQRCKRIDGKRPFFQLWQFEIRSQQTKNVIDQKDKGHSPVQIRKYDVRAAEHHRNQTGHNADTHDGVIDSARDVLAGGQLDNLIDSFSHPVNLPVRQSQ